MNSKKSFELPFVEILLIKLNDVIVTSPFAFGLTFDGDNEENASDLFK